MAQLKYYPTHPIHDIREMLVESTARYGTRPAFYQKKDGKYKSISYATLLGDVNALGSELLARGFGGKRIIVMGENCYEWCLSYLAVICGLGVVVPVDKEIPAEEIANIASISEAALVLCSPKYAGKLTTLPKGVEVICFDALCELIKAGDQRIVEGDTAYAERSIDIDEMSVLLFTSGTTGVSKGVMLSQRNLCTNLVNLTCMVHVNEHDRALSVLPLHHVYECTCGFLFPLSRGASVAFSEGVRYIMKNLQEVQPTKMLCVPLLVETMYRKIWTNIRKKGIEGKVRNIIRLTNAIQPYSARMAAKRKVFAEIHRSLGGHIDLLISGGAPIRPEILRGMRDFGFRIIQGYGLTETAPLAAVNHDSFFNDRAAGLCLPGGALKIIDAGEDGTGEICYRGDNVMLGYYGEPELTAAVKKNGWLHTGDVGYIDDEGFLIITGRKKNVIVTANGKNIFPEELEAYLSRSPYVSEVVVTGIMNEKKGDYDIVAAVYPDMDYAKEALGKDVSLGTVETILEEAVKTVNETVQSYKRIQVLLVRNEEFPKNTSKKIKRFEVKDLILQEYLAKVQE